ncbi:MAG: hypothetical protein II994_05315 [Lachnospiraceae bacterium]|nr:hypothetical protein [Lachnospiraceae bacterium]
MIWKKGTFSYVTWVLYMLIVGIGLVVSLAGMSTRMGYSAMPGFVANVMVLATAGVIVWFLQKKSQDNPPVKRISFKEANRQKTELYIVAGMLLVGLIVRIVGMKNAPLDSSYYQAARIASDVEVINRVHGIDHLYVQMLHKLFFVFGNKIMVAYRLQLFLQLGGLIFGYFAVRKFVGYLPAMMLLLYGILSPLFLAEVCELSPRMLYFFFYAGALWLLGILLKNRTERKKFWCLSGVIIGFLIYLDITGVGLLIVLVCGVFLLKPAEAEKTQIPFLEFLAGLAGCLIGIWGSLIVDSFASHTEISRVFLSDVRLYIPDMFGLDSIDFLLESRTEFVILLIVMSVGIFSFPCNRKTDESCVWVLVLALEIFVFVAGVLPGVMKSPFWLCFYMSILAGVGVQNTMKLFKFEFGDKQEPQEKSWPLGDDEPKGEPGKVVTVEVDGQKKEVKLLDNPLPVPKKKIRKAMDYDIEVSEDDDYDIK